MLGGGSGFAGNTAGVSTYGGSAPGGAPSGPTRGGVSSYGGMAYNKNNSSGPASAGGLPNIPGRPLRTSPTTSQQAPAVDPDTQAVLMEAHRIHSDNQQPKGGKYPSFPPLPPTQLSPQMQNVPPPPGPPGPY